MTFEQIVTDVGAGVAALAAIATVLAHLPFMPAKYAEFFARVALYASNAKFSVNQRDTMPKPPLKISYLDNEDEAPAPRPAIPPGALIVGLVAMLSLTSCSIFGSGGSFWPKVEKCAPSPASLVSQVADILIAGGDYEAALKALALQDTAMAVECAVRAAVDSLMGRAGKVGASPEDGPAIARGKMFLSKHPVSE